MGTSPARATLELGLVSASARRFERAFRAKVQRAEGDSQTPKFARHEDHVAAAMAEGGFCAFSERRLAGEGVGVCMPLIWPRKSSERGRG